MTVSAPVICLVWRVLAAPTGPTDPADPADSPAAVADPDAVATPILVVLVGSDRGHAADAAAIAAHLHGLDIALHTRAGAPEAASALAQYRIASRIAAEEGARAVIWVDRDAKRDYVLHAVRPQDRTIFLRTVERDPAAPSAGLEALGIVTRSIAEALVSGAPLEMDAIDVPPEPTPADTAPAPAVAPTPPRAPSPAARTRARGRALLGVGYVGTSYARQVPWQSGAALQAAWGWPFGLHLGIGYAVMQRVRARSRVGSVEVRRHPTEVFAGWHARIRGLWLGAELAVIVDPATRIARGASPAVAASPDRLGVSTALAPRARVAVVALWRIEVFATVAMEAWLSRTVHGITDEAGEVRELLTPRRIRATTAAGLALRL